MRGFVYSFLGNNPDMIMEYEIKVGKSLIVESSYSDDTIRQIDESWDFVREKLLIQFPLLVEGLWDWVSEKGSQAMDWVKKQGQDILKGGISVFFDKLREFLYSPVGIGLDVALSSIGVGKIASMVIWGAMLIWEIYIASTEGLSLWNGLNILFASIGVLVPALAKSAKLEVGAVKNAEQLAKTSVGGKLLSTLKGSLSKVMDGIKQGAEWLGGVFGPTVKGWVSSAVNGAESMIKKVIEILTPKSSLTGQKVTTAMAGKALQKGVKTTLLNTGIIKGIESETGQNAIKYVANQYNKVTGKNTPNYATPEKAWRIEDETIGSEIKSTINSDLDNLVNQVRQTK